MLLAVAGNKARSASQVSTLARSRQSASKALNLYSRTSSSYVICCALTAEKPRRRLRILARCLAHPLASLGRGSRPVSVLREMEKDIMEQFKLSSDSTSDDLIPFAFAIHTVQGVLRVIHEARTIAVFKLKMTKRKIGTIRVRYFKEFLPKTL